uniref:uncharacterized protein LOC117267390 n=1 Tax=Epinephelus lanceolatus TaxID=310571 RepID=UPI0014458637|nr:uncharacterized protein LOC117267390 [Epinephelus lanceolatus]
MKKFFKSKSQSDSKRPLIESENNNNNNCNIEGYERATGGYDNPVAQNALNTQEEKRLESEEQFSLQELAELLGVDLDASTTENGSCCSVRPESNSRQYRIVRLIQQSVNKHFPKPPADADKNLHQHLIDVKETVRKELVKLGPLLESVGLLGCLIECYHRQTFRHLDALLQNISSPQSSLALIKWASQTYLSQDLLGHPDLQKMDPIKEADLLLFTEWVEKAKDKLLENVQDVKRRNNAWKYHIVRLIQQSVNQHFPEPPADVDKNLHQHLIDVKETVHKELVKLGPRLESVGLSGHLIGCYHHQTFRHLDALLQDISSPQSSLALIKWVFQTYLSQDLLGHPDLQKMDPIKEVDLLLLTEWVEKAKDKLLENVQTEVRGQLEKILQIKRGNEADDELHLDTILCIEAMPKEAQKISPKLSDRLQEVCFQELLLFLKSYSATQTERLGEMAKMDNPEMKCFFQTLNNCKNLKLHVQNKGTLLEEAVAVLENLEDSTVKLVMEIVADITESHLKKYFKSENKEFFLLIDEVRNHFSEFSCFQDIQKDLLGHPDLQKMDPIKEVDLLLLTEWVEKAKDKLLENVQTEVRGQLEKILQIKRGNEADDELHLDTILCIEAMPKEAQKISPKLSDRLQEVCFQELLLFLKSYSATQTERLGEMAKMDNPEMKCFFQTLNNCKNLKLHVQNKGTLLEEAVAVLENLEDSTVKLVMEIVADITESHLKKYFKSENKEFFLLIDEVRNHFSEFSCFQDIQKRVMDDVYKLITHSYLKHLIQNSQSKLRRCWSPDFEQTVAEDMKWLHITISDLAPGVQEWNLMLLKVTELVECKSTDTLKLTVGSMQKKCLTRSEDLELLPALLQWNRLSGRQVKEVLKVLEVLPGYEPRPFWQSVSTMKN